MLRSLCLPHKSQDTTQGPTYKDSLLIHVIGSKGFVFVLETNLLDYYQFQGTFCT